MYTEDYKHNGFFIRKLLLKMILIIAIIVLLIWIVPKLLSYKPSNKIKSNSNSIKITEKNTQKTDFSKNLQTLKEASLMYYQEDKLPKEKEDIEIVTLKQLIDEKLITNLYIDEKKCDTKKSYVKMTRLTDDYLLKATLTCEGKTDYLLVHVGKYDYCTNTVCEQDDSVKEKKEAKEDKDNTTNENNKGQGKEKQQEQEEKIVMKEQIPEDSKEKTETSVNVPIGNNTNKQTTLTPFGAWSNYTKTSCNTKNIICDSNDENCLKEVMVKKEQELIKQERKTYSTISLGLTHNSTNIIAACKNYNYVNIQGVTYKTTGNYEEIEYIGNKMSTDSWKYVGTISTTSTPNFGGNKYYKFIGADYSNCGSTCPNGPSYFYEVYEYTKSLIRTTNLLEGCNGTSTKLIKNYTIVKLPQTVTRTESTYQEVCYESIRTRKVIK